MVGRLSCDQEPLQSPLRNRTRLETNGGGSFARARACSAVAHTFRASREKVIRPSGKRDSAYLSCQRSGPHGGQRARRMRPACFDESGYRSRRPRPSSRINRATPRRINQAALSRRMYPGPRRWRHPSRPPLRPVRFARPANAECWRAAPNASGRIGNANGSKVKSSFDHQSSVVMTPPTQRRNSTCPSQQKRCDPRLDADQRAACGLHQ
jgi:hypothetical protein